MFHFDSELRVGGAFNHNQITVLCLQFTFFSNKIVSHVTVMALYETSLAYKVVILVKY